MGNLYTSTDRQEGKRIAFSATEYAAFATAYLRRSVQAVIPVNLLLRPGTIRKYRYIPPSIYQYCVVDEQSREFLV